MDQWSVQGALSAFGMDLLEGWLERAASGGWLRWLLGALKVAGAGAPVGLQLYDLWRVSQGLPPLGAEADRYNGDMLSQALANGSADRTGEQSGSEPTSSAQPLSNQRPVAVEEPDLDADHDLDLSEDQDGTEPTEEGRFRAEVQRDYERRSLALMSIYNEFVKPGGLEETIETKEEFIGQSKRLAVIRDVELNCNSTEEFRATCEFSDKGTPTNTCPEIPPLTVNGYFFEKKQDENTCEEPLEVSKVAGDNGYQKVMFLGWMVDLIPEQAEGPVNGLWIKQSEIAPTEALLADIGSDKTWFRISDDTLEEKPEDVITFTGFKGNVLKMLARLTCSPHGRALLKKEAYDGGRLIYITPSKLQPACQTGTGDYPGNIEEDEGAFFDYSISKRGFGAGSIVNIDPHATNFQSATVRGIAPQPAFLTIAHELIHADHNQSGENLGHAHHHLLGSNEKTEEANTYGIYSFESCDAQKDLPNAYSIAEENIRKMEPHISYSSLTPRSTGVTELDLRQNFSLRFRGSYGIMPSPNYQSIDDNMQNSERDGGLVSLPNEKRKKCQEK